MNPSRIISSLVIALLLSVTPALAQRDASSNANAALRYWSAFSAMQDSAITAAQAAELNAVLAGRAGYDDSHFSSLIEKNRLPLQIMARATKLPECNWGLDYSLGGNEPVEYARDGLTLGRLNVLYALHLLHAGDKDAAVNALAAGLHFSRDVANDGTLFATLASDLLITEHLRAAEFAVRRSNLSAAQRTVLRNAVAQLGPDGVDWRSAIDHELQLIPDRLPRDAHTTPAVARIGSAYAAALRNPSRLPLLQDALRKYSKFAALMPDPKIVLRQKHDLDGQILEIRSLLG